MTNKKARKLLFDLYCDELGRRELKRRKTSKNAAMDSSSKLPSGWIKGPKGAICITGMGGHFAPKE